MTKKEIFVFLNDFFGIIINIKKKCISVKHIMQVLKEIWQSLFFLKYFLGLPTRPPCISYDNFYFRRFLETPSRKENVTYQNYFF